MSDPKPSAFSSKKIKTKFPKKGEVYWVVLGRAEDSKLAKARPAIVVSKNFCNKNLGRVTVVPITSAKAGPKDTLHDNEVPTYIPNKKGEVVNGKALADQITTIDRKKLSSKICTLSEPTMKKVQEALKKFFELEV